MDITWIKKYLPRISVTKKTYTSQELKPPIEFLFSNIKKALILPLKSGNMHHKGKNHASNKVEVLTR